MFKPIVALAAVAGVLGCAAEPASTSAPLRVASWNMEHLAERGDKGCRPRSDADYDLMRRYAQTLNADVIAFQEVESIAAVSRVLSLQDYTIVIENRPAGTRFPCNGQPGRTLTQQAVGFAIRKHIPFERAPDLTELQLGDPNLRSAVDVTLRPIGREPIRLLSVHLKAGCASGSGAEACGILMKQIPVLETWVDDRARETLRFAVVGDLNRRLARPGDSVWAELDGADPPNADLSLAAGSTGPRCDPRYTEFIDHIILDRRAAKSLRGFEELTYSPGDDPPSDHCPVVALID